MTGKLQSIRIRKTKAREERYAPLLPQVKAAIQDYMDYRQDNLSALWLSEEGVPIKEGHSLGKDLAELFKRIGVKPKDRAHIFRRTFRIEAERQGVPRLHTMYSGGWKTVSVYDSYGEDEKKASVALPAFEKFQPKGV